MLNLFTRLFKVCFSYLLEMSHSRCVGKFLEISSSTVTCTVTGKRVNLGGGYGLEVPCQYSSKGNSLAVRKSLSERIAKEREEERKVVEDALARNQERKTGSREGAAKEY